MVLSVGLMRSLSTAFVGQWCYKCGPLRMIGQVIRDGIVCRNGAKFVNSYWSCICPLLYGTTMLEMSANKAWASKRCQLNNRSPLTRLQFC